MYIWRSTSKWLIRSERICLMIYILIHLYFLLVLWFSCSWKIDNSLGIIILVRWLYSKKIIVQTTNQIQPVYVLIVQYLSINKHPLSCWRLQLGPHVLRLMCWRYFQVEEATQRERESREVLPNSVVSDSLLELLLPDRWFSPIFVEFWTIQGQDSFHSMNYLWNCAMPFFLAIVMCTDYFVGVPMMRHTKTSVQLVSMFITTVPS